MTNLGTVSLSLYRLATRLRCKLFSVLISGAFAEFGKQSTIMYPLRVSGERRIRIGDRVFIGAGSWLQTLSDDGNGSVALSIASGTSIAGNCVISAVRSITLGEEVLLARNVYISDHIHKYIERNTSILDQGLDKIQPVVIERGAWLGQNVVVCPGVTIGEGAVIGANSVVTKDVPDHCIAAGSPARVVKVIEREVSHS
jgi:acetyltransferase-like isoleucine patch superfamily enzyme